MRDHAFRKLVARPPRDDEAATPEDEQLAAAIVEEALAGLSVLLPPHALQQLREELEDELILDPTGARLLRLARPDPVVARSGQVSRRGAPHARKRPA